MITEKLFNDMLLKYSAKWLKILGLKEEQVSHHLMRSKDDESYMRTLDIVAYTNMPKKTHKGSKYRCVFYKDRLHNIKDVVSTIFHEYLHIRIDQLKLAKPIEEEKEERFVSQIERVLMTLWKRPI